MPNAPKRGRPRRRQSDASEVNEERPYSVVVLTLQVRILHDEITRSRLSVNIHPDPMLQRAAEKELTDEQYGTNPDGDFVVNFNPFWIDVNDSYPLFHATDEHVQEMNEAIRKSVNWVLDQHKRILKSSKRN